MATTNRNYKQSRFMTDAIMESSQIAALGFNEGSQVANVARSGQLGVGLRSTKLDGSTPAVFNPAAAIVLNTPQIFDNIPNASECLRALMETHAKSITGIDVNYTVETGETQVGHDGQVLKVPTKTTRAQISPSVTFEEYQGLPVWNLFREWMFAMQHPDTNMSILPAQISDTAEIPAWFMTAYSMSMLFIQYDPSGLPDRIYDAMIICNMFPTDIGDIGFERTIGTTQLKERSVSFSGLVQHNENTRELGYRVAELLQLHKINYNFALPGVAGTVDVNAAIEENIRPYGGLEYEAGPEDRKSRVRGSIDQFEPLGRSEEEYDDTYNPSGSMAQTGAATANPTSKSMTDVQFGGTEV